MERKRGCEKAVTAQMEAMTSVKVAVFITSPLVSPFS
jgi:hypothetical protein